MEGYKESGQTSFAVNSGGGVPSFGLTQESYDVNGFLTSVSDTEPTNPVAAFNNRTFINDAFGNVLVRNNLATGGQERLLVANGQVIADYGMVQHGSFPNGVPIYTPTGNFSMGYEPVTNSYPGASVGSYAVRAGDTLKSIALAAYGDASLWYLIADANGLTGDADLKVGQTLNIPTRVGGVHNSASTTGVFDPSRIQGSTSPQLPTPTAPASGGGCGIGQIIVVVVAAVVAFYTGQYELLSEGGAEVGAGAAADGLTAVAADGGIEVAGAYTYTASDLISIAAANPANLAVAGAVGGAAGSIAGQLVGNVLGVQDGFSWKQVALSAISGGVGSVLGGVTYAGQNYGGLMSGPGPAMAVARAAIGSAVSQGAAVALGLQHDFSWKQVAASAVGAGVGSLVQGPASSVFGNSNPGQFATALTSSLAAGATTAALKGGHFSIQQVATDAFGNAIGSSLANVNGQSAGSSSGQQEDVLGEFIRQNNGWSDLAADQMETLHDGTQISRAAMLSTRAPWGSQLAGNDLADIISDVGVLSPVRIEAYDPSSTLMYAGGAGRALLTDGNASTYLNGTLVGNDFTAGAINASSLGGEQWDMVSGRLDYLNNQDQPGLWHDIKAGFDGLVGIQPNAVLTDEQATERGMLIALQANHVNNTVSDLLGPDFQMQPPSMPTVVNPEVWNERPSVGVSINALASNNLTRLATATSVSGWKSVGSTLAWMGSNAAMAESGQMAPLTTEHNLQQAREALGTLGAAGSIGLDVAPELYGVAAGTSAAARLAGSGIAATGRWLAPTAADMLDQMAARLDMRLYAMEPGASLGSTETAGAGATSPLGRVISSHTAVDPGPLDPGIAGTFAGGRYLVVQLENDTTLYRAGVADKPLGQFFDTAPPDGVLQTRIDKAVLPVWPGGGTSPIDTSFAIGIPKGTTVYVGEVGSQGGFYVGGTQQVVVLKPWTIDGVQVLGSTPLH